MAPNMTYSAAFIKRQNKMQYYAIENAFTQSFAIICDFIAKRCNIFNLLCVAYIVNVMFVLGDKLKSIATFCILEVQ